MFSVNIKRIGRLVVEMNGGLGGSWWWSVEAHWGQLGPVGAIWAWRKCEKKKSGVRKRKVRGGRGGWIG